MYVFIETIILINSCWNSLKIVTIL